MDYGSADAVHHATQGEGELSGWLGFVPAPAWSFTLELRTHLRPAVVGRRQLVRLEVFEAPVRTGLQTDYVQSGFCEHGSDEPAHAADPDQDDVHPIDRRGSPALRVEPSDRVLAPTLVHGRHDVRQRLNTAALCNRIRGEVLFRAVLQPNTGMTEEAPAEFVAVATIGRIGKESLLQVR